MTQQGSTRSRLAALMRQAAALLAIAALGLLVAAAPSQAGPRLDLVPTGPTTGWATNGTVMAIDVEGDTVYAGGSFEWVGRRTGSAVTLTGPTLEGAAIAPGTLKVGGGRVLAAISDGLGGWYIGGDFRVIDDGELRNDRHGLAHIMADGTLDLGFRADINDATGNKVQALAIDGAGRLWVGGKFDQLSLTVTTNLGVLDRDSGSAPVPAITQPSQPTTMIVNELLFHTGNSTIYIGASNGLHKATQTLPGTVVTHGSFNGPVQALAEDDTHLIVGGSFSTPLQNLAAIDYGTGNPYTGWNPAPPSPVTALLFDPGNLERLILAGAFDGTAAAPWNGRRFVTALYANITLNNPFASPAWLANTGLDNISPGGEARALAAVGTTLYAGGTFRTAMRGIDDFAQSLDINTGARITTPSQWSPRFSGPVETLQPSGTSLFAGGNFNSVNANWRGNLAAFDATTGALRPLWVPSVDNTVLALHVEGPTVYVGGMFGQTSTANDGPTTATASRLAGFGSMTDPSPGSRTYNGPSAAPIGPVRAITFAGGNLWSASEGGGTNGWVKRYQPLSGGATLDSYVTQNTANNGVAYALATDGTYVYVGGNFQALGGYTHSGLGKIAVTGGTTAASAVFPATQLPANSIVKALALQGTNSVVVAGGMYAGGGHLSAYNTGDGSARAGVPVVTGAGTLYVDALAAVGADVYVGGDFDQLGGSISPNLGRFEISGGAVDNVWKSNTDGAVLALHAGLNTAIPARQVLQVGGQFTSVSSQPAEGFAQFRENLPPPPPDTLATLVLGVDRTGQWVNQVPELRFNAYADPDGDTYGYRVEVSPNQSYVPLVDGKIEPIWTFTGASIHSFMVPDLVLPDGQYTWRVRTADALRAAGGWVEFDLTGMEIKLDRASPTPSAVKDGATPGVDIASTGSTTIYANWGAFNDNGLSGVASYQWCVRTTVQLCTTDAILPWTTVGVTDLGAGNWRAASAPLPLADVGSPDYMMCVRAFDAAGNPPTQDCSNGLDYIAGSLLPGPASLVGNTGAFHTSATAPIYGNWGAASDPEVVGYQWCVVPTPGPCATFTSTPAILTGAINPTPTWTNGQVQHLCVASQHVLGSISGYQCSPPMLVDLADPSVATTVTTSGAIGIAYDGATTVYVDDPTPTGAAFTISAMVFDGESGTAGAPSFAPSLGPQWAVTGGPTSYTYTFAGGTAVPGSVLVTGADLAGHTASRTISVVVDSTPPNPFTVNVTPTNTMSNAATVTLAGVSDAGSGVFAGRMYQRQRGSVQIDGTCAAPADDGPPASSGDSYAATGLAGGCYRWRVAVKDNVGNEATQLSPIVTTDTTPPLPVNVDTPAATNVAGTVSLGGDAVDADSNLASVTVRYHLLPAGAWSATQVATYTAGRWSWSWATPAPDGAYEISVTATNYVGGATSNTKTFTVDNTAPGASIASITEASTQLHAAGSNLWFGPGVPAGTQFGVAVGSGSADANSVSFTDISADVVAFPVADVFGPAPFVNTYAFASVPAADQSKTFTVLDTTGNAGSATMYLKRDATAPTFGVSLTGANPSQSGSWTVAATTPADGTGSGLADRVFQRQRAAIATNGTCGAFANDGAPVIQPSNTLNETVTAAGCYRYQVTVYDNVANGITQSTATMKSDTTAPAPVNVNTPAAATVGGTVNLGGNAVDTDSNIASVTVRYHLLPAGAWSAVQAAPHAAGLWSWAWATPAPDGAYEISITATNFVGGATSATRTLTVDNTGPSASLGAVTETSPALHRSGPTLWFNPNHPSLPGTPFGVEVTTTAPDVARVEFPTIATGIVDRTSALNDTSAPYAGNFTFTAAPGGNLTGTFTAYDLLNNAGAPAATLSLNQDAQAPSLASTLSAPAFTSAISATVDATAGTDSAPASGNALVDIIATDVSTSLPVAGSCGTDTAMRDVCTFNSLTDGQYVFVARASDNVGNWSAPQSLATHVDRLAPNVDVTAVTPGMLPAGVWHDGLTTLWYRPGFTGTATFTVAAFASDPDNGTPADPGSNLATVAFPNLSGSGTQCQTTPTGAASSAATCTYSFGSSVTSGTRSVTATDRAANPGPGAVVTTNRYAVTSDGTLPDGTAVVPPLAGTSVTVNGTASDVGAGVQAATLRKIAPDLTQSIVWTGSSATWSYPWNFSTETQDGTWSFELEVTDHVGNTRVIRSNSVQVNNNPAPAQPQNPVTIARTIGALPKLSTYWGCSCDQDVLGYELQFWVAGTLMPAETVLGSKVKVMNSSRIALLGGATNMTGTRLSLIPGRSYEWHVRAIDETVPTLFSPWSDIASFTVPKVTLQLASGQLNDGDTMRSCGWIDEKCHYARGDRIHLWGSATPVTYAADHTVAAGLFRLGADGWVLKDQLASMQIFGTGGAGQFAETVALDLAPGTYRVQLRVAGDDKITAATTFEYFIID